MIKFPVPTTSNFGIHWLALNCMDVRSRAWIRDKLAFYRSLGAQHVKLLTSPGGDEGWSYKELGCSEWTFKLALELGMQPTLRIAGSTNPPYWTTEREVMMRRFVDIAKEVADEHPDRFQEPDFWFAVEPANEIDVKNEEAGDTGIPTPHEAARAFATFAENARGIGVFPLVPSVGYGGPKDYLTPYHQVGLGHVLDISGIAVHPYAGPFPIHPYWPWHPILTQGTPVTQEEWDSYHPWCWDIGSGNPRSIELVNQWRQEDAELRASLTTIAQLYAVYNYGWFTILWVLWLLDSLGHLSTDLYLTECGTRRGEMYGTLPRVDPNLHRDRTVEMIIDAMRNPRIKMTAHWLNCNMKCAGNKPNWEDQAWESYWLDPSIVELPWSEQITTPGFLPIVDYLKRHPAGGNMQSKLMFHIQDYTAEVKAALVASQPAYVKIMTPALNPDNIASIEAAVPGVRIVGRYHTDAQVYQDDPEGRALEFVDKIAATGCGPLVWAWEDYNEVPTSHMSAEDVDAYDRFMTKFNELVRDRFDVEYTVIINSPVGNLGWPGEVMPTQFRRALALPCTVVSFHCYERWKDPSMRDAFLFRWKELKRQIALEYPDKQYLLTEIGVTRATIPGQPDVGWRSPDGYTRAEYMALLNDADYAMALDEDVLGGCVFQTGPQPDWDTFESTAEVAELREEFAPLLPPDPPNPEPPGPPDPEVVNDAVDYGVEIEEANVPEGNLYYKAIHVHHLTPEENRGNHNVYVNVFDEDGNDPGVWLRPNVLFTWQDGGDVITLEKPYPLEPMGNGPLWRGQVGNVEVSSEYPSDRVVGMHTGHPDEPPLPDGTLGNSQEHHSFLVEYRLTVKTDDGTAPPPPPTESLEEFIRRKSWDNLYPGSIDYLPTAAFSTYAREHAFGVPTTREFDVVFDGAGYRVQGFSSAIVYAQIGHWQDTTYVVW